MSAILNAGEVALLAELCECPVCHMGDGHAGDCNRKPPVVGWFGLNAYLRDCADGARKIREAIRRWDGSFADWAATSSPLAAVTAERDELRAVLAAIRRALRGGHESAEDLRGDILAELPPEEVGG